MIPSTITTVLLLFGSPMWFPVVSCSPHGKLRSSEIRQSSFHDRTRRYAIAGLHQDVIVPSSSLDPCRSITVHRRPREWKPGPHSRTNRPLVAGSKTEL
ncbi:uncharacterized protein B0T23DRAFT_387150, partial [Neurospora hispaniola]